MPVERGFRYVKPVVSWRLVTWLTAVVLIGALLWVLMALPSVNQPIVTVAAVIVATIAVANFYLRRTP